MGLLTLTLQFKTKLEQWGNNNTTIQCMCNSDALISLKLVVGGALNFVVVNKCLTDSRCLCKIRDLHTSKETLHTIV